MLQVAIEAAREAGRFLKLSVGRVRNVETKKGEERNLVSEADRGAEERIVGVIRRHYPHHAILAEEGGRSGGAADHRWVIDPLDGTTNFLHGVPIFSVSIAVERRGELIAGVVYDPNLDEMFTAEKGAGAYCNGRRLRVSAKGAMIDSLLVTGFPYDISRNPGRALEHFVGFLMAARGVRRLGSAAMDLAYVAAGRFDGFWEVRLNPWDMAAGALLIAEAGGRTSDFAGAPLDIYQESVLASNGLIHEAMLGILAAAPSTAPGSSRA